MTILQELSPSSSANLIYHWVRWWDSLCATNTILLQHYQFNWRLDRGSIRSSPRYGLSSPYRLTNRNSAGLFHYVLIYMGSLHLVLPALLFTLGWIRANCASSEICILPFAYKPILNIWSQALHYIYIYRLHKYVYWVGDIENVNTISWLKTRAIIWNGKIGNAFTNFNN